MAKTKHTPQRPKPQPKVTPPSGTPKSQENLSEWPDESITSRPAKEEPKKSKKEKKAKFDRTYGKKFDEVLYPDIKLWVYRDASEEAIEASPDVEMGKLDIEAATSLLGWDEEDETLGNRSCTHN